jgi:hypothetical protein
MTNIIIISPLRGSALLIGNFYNHFTPSGFSVGYHGFL